jgi:hypothetical protein
LSSYLKPGSISTSNERPQNRHAARLFFPRFACASSPAGRAPNGVGFSRTTLFKKVGLTISNRPAIPPRISLKQSPVLGLQRGGTRKAQPARPKTNCHSKTQYETRTMQFTVEFVGATSQSILQCSDCLGISGVHGHAFVGFVFAKPPDFSVGPGTPRRYHPVLANPSASGQRPNAEGGV